MDGFSHWEHPGHQPRGEHEDKGVPQTPAHSQMEEVELATLLKRQKDIEYFYSLFDNIICHFSHLAG